MTTLDWGSAEGVKTPNRKEVDRLKIDTGSSITVRLVGGLLPRYVYWVTNNEGKRTPVECLEFIREKEKFDANQPNPFKEIPESVFSDKPQFAYVCNVIDRTDGSIKLYDLKRTIYTQLLEFAQNPEYGNPADPKIGYDVTIKKEKTGALPQNVKYSVMPSRKTSPLTDEEKNLELYDLDKMNPRPTYEEQKEWLLQNTQLFAGTDEGQDAMGVPGETSEDLA